MMPMHPRNPYDKVAAAQGVPPMAAPPAPRLGLLDDPARPGHLDPAASPVSSPRLAAGMTRVAKPMMPGARMNNQATSAMEAAGVAAAAGKLDTMAKRGLTRRADRVSKVFGRDAAPSGRQDFLRDKIQKMAGNQGLLGRQFLKRGDY